MTYENAPATKMIATNCACCARALVDAVSVETGVGPDCREKHGYAEAQGEPNWLDVGKALEGLAIAAELMPHGADVTDSLWRLGGGETRKAANLLVSRIAFIQTGAEVLAMSKALHALGYQKLACRIGFRIAPVHVKREGLDMVIRAPFNVEAKAAWYALGGHFDKKSRRHVRPASKEREIWTLLRRYYAGQLMVSRAGLTIIPSLPPAPVAVKVETTNPCFACKKTGAWTNGVKVGKCFRCGGKGFQTAGDVARCKAYDAHRMSA